MIFLAKGKRGNVYLAKHKGKTVVVKQARATSTVINRLENEAYWLKKLNKYSIGPKFISLAEGKIMMEYVQGETIQDYLRTGKPLKKIAREVLEQCRVMDKLHVNKLEMTNPYKHIIIKKGPVNRKHIVMIDFERCKQTPTPKNVTQFCQYLVKRGWDVDKKQLQQALQNYKQDYSLRSFRLLLRLLF